MAALPSTAPGSDRDDTHRQARTRVTTAARPGARLRERRRAAAQQASGIYSTWVREMLPLNTHRRGELTNGSRFFVLAHGNVAARTRLGRALVPNVHGVGGSTVLHMRRRVRVLPGDAPDAVGITPKYRHRRSHVLASGGWTRAVTSFTLGSSGGALKRTSA
jgi:hypothetical protein